MSGDEQNGVNIDETLPFEVVDEDLPTVYTNISISTYGIARRCYEENMDRVNDIMLDPKLDDDTKQIEMDKWQSGADKQRVEIEKFEQKCPEYDSKYLGDNIKVLAKKHNLRIPDVENLVGVSSGYISRTVNPDSKKRLSIDIVWKLSKVFSVNMSDLLDRDLTEPPKTIIPVKQFFEKLTKETSEADLHWKNLGNTYNSGNADFFEQTEDKDGKMKWVFSAPDDEWISALDGAIYVAQINGRPTYIIPVDTLFADKGVLIYTKRYYDTGFDQYQEDISLLCSTMDDSSGILYARATELLNVIKLHENDFTVSEDAKSFIEGYLNPDENLPFV